MRILLLMVLLCPDFALGNEQTLIGGKIAKPGMWPEVVYITNGKGACTATVVGPNVILTAAHCVKDGGDIRPLNFVIEQTVYQAKCTHHPMYKDKYSYDFALCKVNSNIDVQYASIANEGPELDKDIMLMGYGCIKKGGGSGNDGKLRYGKAKVTALPSDTYNHAGGQYFYTKGSSALCFGDSGGPAMLANTKKHIVIGVNSRGNIKDWSLLSSTFLNGFRDFASDFENKNNVEICGISKNCLGNKSDDDSDDNNDNDDEPKDNKPCRFFKYYQKKVDYYNKKLLKYKGKLEECKNEVEITPYIY